MKKALLTCTALAFAVGISSAAIADERRDPVDISASPADNAQCDTGAASGAFGWLGADYNPSDPTLFGNDGERGVNGKTRTGPNNSGVCGSVPEGVPD